MKLKHASLPCRLIGLAFLGFFLISPPILANANEVFEGRVKMKMSDETTAQTIDYYVKGERMRIETEDPRFGGGAMIMDMNEKELIMLMPEQQMFMTMPIPDITDTGQEHKKPESTGETRRILGYTAQKYTVEYEDVEYEVWATDELGTFTGLHLPDNDKPGAASPRDRTIAEEDFFPLLIVERRNGREQSRVEVTEIEKETLPDSLFEPPPDYRGMDMPFHMPE